MKIRAGAQKAILHVLKNGQAGSRAAGWLGLAAPVNGTRAKALGVGHEHEHGQLGEPGVPAFQLRAGQAIREWRLVRRGDLGPVTLLALAPEAPTA